MHIAKLPVQIDMQSVTLVYATSSFAGISYTSSLLDTLTPKQPGHFFHFLRQLSETAKLSALSKIPSPIHSLAPPYVG